MIQSIIICRHGKHGFSASLRFKDSRHDIDISANNKYSLYKNIDYIVNRELKNEDNIAN